MNEPPPATTVAFNSNESPNVLTQNQPARFPSKRNFPSSSRTKSTGPKKPRFTGPVTGRRGAASYQKQSEPNSIMAVSRLSYFPVYTSNLGCRSLTELVYQVIRSKDYRLAQNFTQLQLEYVTTVSFCNRVVQTARTYGYAFPFGASRLKEVASGIRLPAILASYIESIGSFELTSGAIIVPFAASYEDLFPDGSDMMIDPAAVLLQAGRPIPDGPWALDVEWILAYNAATTRGSRSGMQFRIIDNSGFVGDNKMMVSWMGENINPEITPFAPEKITKSELSLGACYRFRQYDRIRAWFGTNKQLLFNTFTTTPCTPEVLVTDACVASFTGEHQQ